MRRFTLVLFVATMAFSTSGLLDLAVPELCSIDEASGQEDGSCAANCVRCNCCARLIEVTPPRVVSVRIPIFTEAISIFELVPTGNPSDILHVPKRSTI